MRPAPVTEGAASVRTDIGRGTLVLARGDREVLLRWKQGEEKEARPLPPGTYRLRTTRIERAQDGALWFLSLSGPPGEPRRFEAGKTTTIRIGTSVHFEAHAKRKGGELRLGFALRGADGRGLSIYRDGERRAVTYSVLDRKGKLLASGRMNYG